MTPEVQDVMQDAALSLGFVPHATGGGHYEIRHLPAAGGLDDQDARLLAGLQVVMHTRNAMVREFMEARSSRRRE